jgi:hypothetical protein
MQRDFCGATNRRLANTQRNTSKKRVVASTAPPPPPLRPPDDELEELDELELELELELEELLPVPGVGPDVTGVAQAAVPAEEGAAVVADAGRTTTSALSLRPRLSFTVSRSVMLPEVGARTVTVRVSAPDNAGGLLAGDTTDQAKPVTVRPQAAALPPASKDAS